MVCVAYVLAFPGPKHHKSLPVTAPCHHPDKSYMLLPAFGLIPLKPGCNCLHHPFGDDGTTQALLLLQAAIILSPSVKLSVWLVQVQLATRPLGQAPSPRQPLGNLQAHLDLEQHPSPLAIPPPPTAARVLLCLELPPISKAPLQATLRAPSISQVWLAPVLMKFSEMLLCLLFSQVVGPTTQLGMAVSGAHEGCNDAALYAQVF